MTKIIVSKVGPERKIDVKIHLNAKDKVEAYPPQAGVAARVVLKREQGRLYSLPQDAPWREGEEVNILINYPYVLVNRSDPSSLSR